MPLAFKHKKKVGMEGLFLYCPAPRGSGSEILAAARAGVKKIRKHGVVLESWAEGLRGCAQPELPSRKASGILD